jgi:signal transduction histidine kinase
MDNAWRPRARLRLARPLPLRPLSRVCAADVLLAAGLVAAFSEPGLDSYHHDGGTGWAIAGVLGAAALAWRRVAPRTVWLVSTAAAALLLVTRRGPDWGGLSPLVLTPAALAGLYGLTCRSSRRAGQLAALVTLTALEAGLLAHPTRPEAVVTVAALTLAAWTAGESASARDRALAAERAALDLRAAADERARIARELHDILAHHVSVISLQAGTARLLAESGTPPDAALLGGIETASRQAMAELRQALGVIRHTPGGAGPLPSLAGLPALAARTGLAVTIDGETAAAQPDGLPAAVELTAYRVIQESLTNVLRHSAARSARVTLRRAGGALHVTVTDDGPARGGRSGDGYGLRGLGERVAAQAGTFRAGPRPGPCAHGTDRGFEVAAVLPLRCGPPEPGAGA